MELRGQIDTIYTDMITGQAKLQFTVSNGKQALIESEKYRGKELRIEVKRWRERRSKDANAYMWELLEQIGDRLGKSKDEVYLDELEKYGVFTHIVVQPAAVDRLKQEYRIVRELGEITTGSMTGIQLQCYFGSSTYDTKEMSRLLDGVIDDAKALDIDTTTPDEIERMKAEWGVQL